MAANGTQLALVQVDFCNELLSSSELFQSRSQSHKIPVRGQKEFLPNKSEQQKACLQKTLDEHWVLVKEERVERVGNLVNAEWIPEEKLVKLKSPAGKFWQTMGYSDQGKQCLFPEEALYLMECGNVQVFYHDLPISIQEGYESFLSAETVTFIQYQVFGHLKRLGYVVKRFDTRLPSLYRQQLNLPLSNNRLHKLFKRKWSLIPGDRLCNKKSTENPEVSAGHHEGELKTNVPYSSLESPGQLQMQQAFQDLGSYNANCASLPPPDPSLLPGALQVQECHLAQWHRNINMRQELWSKQEWQREQNQHRCNINDDQRVRHCRNWVEYLELVDKRRSKQHNERPKHYGEQQVLPLAQPRKCSSHRELLEHINIIQSYDLLTENSRLPCSELWRIIFNLYQPDTEFKKSCPGKPYTRLCVCSFDEPVPNLHVLNKLSLQSGDVAMTFAVVDHGDISFYSFKDFKLPTDVY
ncbi:tRNA-splicing endonuclease subunit Sen54 isoform X3 [Tachysurus vachellii]|uniref:tRNA-splicing endonuclease subunit Sen54 isoform X3 n=1 Tax=Tachysurus vachellii TaxID=175792 RepID=UPI00296A9AAF|nr:tRNA-splicing endonuclease subunit Sen54 isoform X3 [Tachysurus vachellii]